MAWIVWIIIAVCSLAVFFLIIAAIDSNRFVVQEYSIRSEKVICNTRFVFLTDLHLKEYGRENEKLLEKIRQTDPDFILVGGDMLNAVPGKDFHKAVSFLQKLAAEYRIYYAYGNHEYRIKLQPEKYGEMWENYRKELEHPHIIFLDNQSEEFADRNIRVTGFSLGRRYYKRWGKRVLPEHYLEEKMGERKDGCFQILLAHNPEFFREYAKWDPDLVLSGHIHGGVVRLPFLGGVIAPSLRLFPHYTGGIYREFGHLMILGRGLGMHTIPIRIWNPGELMVVNLESEKAEEE